MIPTHDTSRPNHVLVSGGAGFVGSTLVDRLLADGRAVTVVDSFDDYYDSAVKRANLSAALGHPRCRLIEHDIGDGAGLAKLVPDDVDAIVHLAGRPGVRPSITEPERYFRTNTLGTVSMLELARSRSIQQFVFASSSSVYGSSPDLPWREDVVRACPASPYGASKLAAEAAGQAYTALHDIRFIALRLFTVYGPRQRPDLAIHKFARLMLVGERIPFFGDGTTSRDYTYVDDTVAGITAALDYRASDFEIINLGGDHPVSLSTLVTTLSGVLGISPILERLPDQVGDLPATWANVDKASRLLGWAPNISLGNGLRRFAQWLEEAR
jgi:UDP-glucuronate 4-epimerase